MKKRKTRPVEELKKCQLARSSLQHHMQSPSAWFLGFGLGIELNRWNHGTQQGADGVVVAGGVEELDECATG